MSSSSSLLSNSFLSSFDSTTFKFPILIKLKYLFLIIKLILMLCVYLTYDENLFSGLSLIEERESENYYIARANLITGLTFLSFFAIGELVIIYSGYTIKFHKNNILILTLNVFAIFLLGSFIVHAWHYVTIWYIFIVAQVPQSLMELYGFIYSVVYEFAVYSRVKGNTLRKIKFS